MDWRILIGMFAALTLVVTVLPFVRTDLGWVRIWDFPRLQVMVCAAFALLLALVFWRHATAGHATIAAMIAVIAYQAWRIYEYTPLAAVQVAPAQAIADADCFSVLSVNVLADNRDFGRLEALVRQYQPDIALLLEPDRWWAERLDTLFADYPHRLAEPLDNRYGLMFYTRLKAEALELRHLIEPDIPSVFARLRLASGRAIEFHGIHPRPPLPSQDTGERDAELIVVGRSVADRDRPAIVAGDLNDVAWSHTSRLFRRISQMLDPRIGRGLYATFHADYRLARYPLDHLYVTPDFLLRDLAVLDHIGSDHFPIFARLCLSPQAPARNEKPEAADGDDREEAAEIVRDGAAPEGAARD